MKHWSELLIKAGACSGALEWAQTQPDLSTAWNACERADWLLWFAVRAGVDRRLCVLAAADCAETASAHWTPDTELACIWAIDAARRWAVGDAEVEEVWAAARSAFYAADATATADAFYAAAATATATATADDDDDAATATAAAAALAADAYYAAFYAADATATATAARARHLKKMCKLVRARIPFSAAQSAVDAYVRTV